jgi:hypothetical protein
MSGKSASRFMVSVLVLACAGALLAGCKKDSSPTGPGGGTGGVVTVSGKVVDGNLQPISGIPVLITGKASVNTDANGNFTIGNVTTPYDAALIIGTSKTAYIYRRLTRADPTLFLLSTGPGLANSASISGLVYPASAYPEPAGRGTALALMAPEATVYGSATGTVSPGTYSFPTFSWNGGTTITATLYALQWNYDAAFLPVSYVRYGTHSAISITNGGTLTNVNDTMSATPATITFSGSVTIPTGYVLGNKIAMLQFGGKAAFPLLTDKSPAITFSYKTPDITGGAIGFTVTATKSGAQSAAYRSGLALNGTGVSLTVPAAPELSLPVDGAPSVPVGTQFSWNLFSGGLQVLYFSGPTGQPSIFIMTMAASDSLPNLASVGLPLPAAAAYTWLVAGFAPFASIDAAAGPTGFLPPGYPLYIMSGTGSYGITPTRSFTTAP